MTDDEPMQTFARRLFARANSENEETTTSEAPEPGVANPETPHDPDEELKEFLHALFDHPTD